MRILQLIESLGRGGAEHALLSGLPALAARGHQVELWALRPPADLLPNFLAHNIHTKVLEKKWPLLPALAARFCPDVIHTHLFFANLCGRAAALLYRTPLCTSLHNPDYSAEGGGRWNLRRSLDRISAGLAPPTFVAVSSGVQADYREQMGYDSQVVWNPIDPFWLRPGPSRQAARQQLQLSQTERVIFGCGRLHRQKGFDVLADATTDLPSTRVVIAGEGAERAQLAHRLQLIGSQDRNGLRLWLAACDVVVVPSRYEAFGIFAAEALAAGCALVCSDVPGLRECVGDAALLVPSEDVVALGQVLKKVLTDSALADSLRQKGPPQAARYTPAAWAERMEQIYLSLCS